MLLTKRVKLSESRKGDVCRFDYGKNKSQGDIRRVGRIEHVRDTVKNPILASSRSTNQIDRSRYLLTVREPNGQIRQVYGEKIAEDSRRYTLLGRLVVGVVKRNIKFYCG